MMLRGPSAACPLGNEAQSPFNKTDTHYRAQDNMVSVVTANHRLGIPSDFPRIDLRQQHVRRTRAKRKLNGEV